MRLFATTAFSATLLSLGASLVLALPSAAQEHDDDDDDDEQVLMSTPGYVQIDATGGPMTGLQVNMPGLQVNMPVVSLVKPGKKQGHKKPPALRPVGMKTFNIFHEQMGDGSLRLLSPEGARADVWDDSGEYLGGFDLPTQLQVRSRAFYRVVISDRSSVLFDRKLESKDYYNTVVAMVNLPPTVVVQPVVLTPAVPVAPTPTCNFPALLAAVQGESFSAGKLDVIATSRGTVTVEQVGALVDAIDFAADKVKAVRLLRPRVIDPQNAISLGAHFDFDADKQAVRTLFAG